MRVSRQQAAENRQRIVEAASRLFRERGFDGVGVDAVLKEAGLTHGGFYGHFASKDALIAEAVAQAMDTSPGWRDIGELAKIYLSPDHCADRAGGCAVAALGADYARHSKGLRRTVADGMRCQIERIAGLFRRGTPTARRRQAIVTYAGLVGALTLARAVDDPALAEEILVVARETFGREPA